MEFAGAGEAEAKACIAGDGEPHDLDIFELGEVEDGLVLGLGADDLDLVSAPLQPCGQAMEGHGDAIDVG